jgi:hypothetical protein
LAQSSIWHLDAAARIGLAVRKADAQGVPYGARGKILLGKSAGSWENVRKSGKKNNYLVLFWKTLLCHNVLHGK